MTILEAMATCLPIVSTSVGGTPEIICHGSSGFLHQPGDYQQMAQTLLNLYWQPALAAAIGCAGRERVAIYFSMTTMVERYENLYRRILKNGERPCVA